MSDVMSRTMSDVISDVDVTGGVVYNYKYDGSTMYATFPKWTPLNAVFSYGCDVVVDVAATGSNQVILRGDSVVGAHQLGINLTGVLQLKFQNAIGSTITINMGTLSDAEYFTATAMYYPTRVDVYKNGVLVGTSTETPDLAAIEYIASTATPSAYFGGTISNVRCKSSSPMQNVNVMAGNGVDRYASFPEIAFGGDYSVEFWSIRKDNAAGDKSKMVGFSSNSRTTILFYNTTSGQANDITIRHNAVSYVFTGALSGIVQGENFKTKYTIVGTELKLFLNDVQFGNTKTVTLGIAQFDALYQGILDSYADTVLTNLVFKDLDTGITHTYNNTDCYEQLGSELVVNDLSDTDYWQNNSSTALGAGTFTTSFAFAGVRTVLGGAYSLEADTQYRLVVEGKSDDYTITVREGDAGAGTEIVAAATTDTTVYFTTSSNSQQQLYLRSASAGVSVHTFVGLSVKQATVILPDSTVTEYGDELWVDPVPDVFSDWAYNGNGVYEKSGVSGGNCGYVNGSSGAPLADTMYRVTANISPTASTLSLFTKDGGTNVAILTGLTGAIDVVVTAGDEGGLWFAKTAFEGTVSNVSFKEVIAIADKKDGEWVNAVIGDLEYLPLTDRLYRINEGSGNVIRDTFNPETELITDPDFDDALAWVVPTECAVVGGEAVFTATTGSRDLQALGGVGVVAGDEIEITMEITSQTSGSIQTNPYPVNWELVSGSTSYSAVGTHTWVLRSRTGVTTFGIRAASGVTISLGSLSVKVTTNGTIVNGNDANWNRA